MGETTVIRGGTVVDGTGAARVKADVAIRDGRIVEIGTDLRGDRVVDATGCVVAPGFIDIHTHYDAQVFWDPALTPSCYHGVTTVVAGNCGFSIAPTRPDHHELIARTLEKVEDMDVASLAAGIPWDFETFPQYLDSVRRHGTLLNYAALIGHTPMRFYAMGDEAVGRNATDEEIASMTAMVREAMDAGAAGFATSFAVTHRGADGRPIPSRWADQREIEALCAVVGEVGRGVVAVNGGQEMPFASLYELQPRINAPITFTALLTSPTGGHLKAIEIHRAGWAKGIKVYPQVSCRPLAFSMTMIEPFTLNTNPVFAELMPRSRDERRAAYADPAWRARAVAAWDNRDGGAIPPQWATFEIMEAPANPQTIGRRLADIATEMGVSPFDALLDLTLAEPDLMLRARAILANGDPEGIAILLQEDGCTLGLSDAGAHVGQLCDAVLSTDLLGIWVREKGVLSLEEAIRKLTSQQAEIFGFTDRGVLRPGAWADVVVFDPETVHPGPLRRVRDFPADAERLTADQPVGMRHLFVNGVQVQRDGVMDVEALASRPGMLVAPGAHR